MEILYYYTSPFGLTYLLIVKNQNGYHMVSINESSTFKQLIRNSNVVKMSSCEEISDKLNELQPQYQTV